MTARVIEIPLISCQKTSLVGGFAIMFRCWSGGLNGTFTWTELRRERCSYCCRVLLVITLVSAPDVPDKGSGVAMKIK